MNKNRVLANVKVDYEELKGKLSLGFLMVSKLIEDYNGEKNAGCVLRLVELVEEVQSKIDTIEIVESVEELDDLIMVMGMMIELYETIKYYWAM